MAAPRGPSAFGFEWDAESKTLSLREDEARVIRHATQAVIAGRTLAAVARDLNEAAVRTSTGNTWTYQRLRDVLIRPTNAGLSATGRADRGQVQVIGEGDWPAIIDADTWQTLYKLLIDPSRLAQNGNTSRWLGSGPRSTRSISTTPRSTPTCTGRTTQVAITSTQSWPRAATSFAACTRSRRTAPS